MHIQNADLKLDLKLMFYLTSSNIHLKYTLELFPYVDFLITMLINNE